jgi:hypothetical protein
MGLAHVLIDRWVVGDCVRLTSLEAREWLTMRDALIAKLRPDRFTAMSGKMAAIVGYILDERSADPAIRARRYERPVRALLRADESERPDP